MRRTREKQQVYIEARFLDRFDRPFTPTTVRYRVEDLNSDTELKPWTALSPAAVIEFPIDASINRILRDDSDYEVKVVTIQSDYGTEVQLSQELEYKVTNLRGFE